MMNERIRELAEQCYHRYSEHNINLEKFAELIVRECAQVVFKKTGPKSALNVLVHFGLEEPLGWICPKCGIDRTVDACPNGHHAALTGQCPMIGVAQ